ncbi:hypothetical protein HN51_061792 [Arachis hypogaea]|uniref:BEL1-like homeodomain protein 2 n=1 Tax=Arachis hypogaea TaxID=3818 RepID=UPI0007AF060E|nr:BEL1-like homeodomain protein 4 isoform X1 [Arachis ipaensis]XP_016184247.1 BEL1-like homeodomain protein 4 isoform X1 [Arachis ipaensis]XP_025627104.1 BEL1-like homeodomain protein 4 [Arachis hypogaea]XP_025627105.1 BEL1-like homeodomain protein 4 [Arachis hypogaea]QHO19128.1 BEL1-like homeodomain protein [Arachis hypogaea]QHO19129.1 BEL1-like homeodomain protein [Arachis hypogaea]
MGIATPPPFPSILSHSKTNNYQQHHSFTIIEKPEEEEEEELNASNSMSQDYHHHNQGIFTFSNNGFERSTQVTNQEHHHQHQHHLAQQIRRDKVRVQGFDPQQPPPAQPPTAIIGIEESGGIPGYETAGMLSEMFNFPPVADAAAGELLEQPMIATFRSPTTTRSLGSDWYAGNRQGMITGLGALGDNSKNNHNQHDQSNLNNGDSGVIVHHQQPQQHHHHNQIPSINADSAAAMQLFLMNPQTTTRSPSPPSSHHTTPTPPSSSSTLHMLLPNPNPNTSVQGFHGGGGTFNQFTWAPDSAQEAQGLSLSLSSSLQHLEAAKAEELRMGESGFLFYNQGGGGPSSSSSSAQYPYKNLPSHHQQHQALHIQGTSLGQNHHQGPIGFGSSSSLGLVNVLRNSKYVKAAQELLEEFCSVGRGQFKKNKFTRQLSNPSSNQGGAAAASSSSSKELPPLSASDRIEHQRRKVKLLTMLDEVDRRYSHYCEQMHMVVNSFDLVMGYGAAVPYTALAQKAMSRHFRCLKDAITTQLKHSCEVLGEKEGVGTTGLTKGETPRLKMLEQSLRQQRAFHQMGMMEQEAWRPQRGLPERSVNILRAWLFEHFLHPYPSDADKHLLARQTGLSRNQVSNWFINARVRLWKPMVEDMYQQELKDAEGATEEEDDEGESNNNSGNHVQTPLPPSSTTTTPPPLQLSSSTPTSNNNNNVNKRSDIIINAQDSDPSLAAINRQGLEIQAKQPATSSTANTTVTPPVVSQCFDSEQLLNEDTCGHGSIVSAEYGSVAAMTEIGSSSSTLIRFGTTAAPGDVSLTLGLRHTGNNSFLH